MRGCRKSWWAPRGAETPGAPLTVLQWERGAADEGGRQARVSPAAPPSPGPGLGTPAPGTPGSMADLPMPGPSPGPRLHQARGQVGGGLRPARSRACSRAFPEPKCLCRGEQTGALTAGRQAPRLAAPRLWSPRPRVPPVSWLRAVCPPHTQTRSAVRAQSQTATF